jgi:hypothetical protein
MKVSTKKMQIYTAHDGEEFHDEAECLAYEAKDPANVIAGALGVERQKVVDALDLPGIAHAFMNFGGMARKQLIDVGEIKPRGRKAKSESDKGAAE